MHTLHLSSFLLFFRQNQFDVKTAREERAEDRPHPKHRMISERRFGAVTTVYSHTTVPSQGGLAALPVM